MTKATVTKATAYIKRPGDQTYTLVDVDVSPDGGFSLPHEWYPKRGEEITIDFTLPAEPVDERMNRKQRRAHMARARRRA